jgi:branched-chain amino acid transport system permease protein
MSDAAPIIPDPSAARFYWVANLLPIGLIAAAWPLSRLFDDRLDPYYLDLLVRIGIAVILAVSLNLINGVTGQFSLGHAAFMAVGGYTCGVILKQYAPAGAAGEVMFLGLTVLGGIMAAIAGLVVGIPSLRLRGDYLAIATLGFNAIITVIINKTDAIGPFIVGGASGLHDIPIPNNFFWTFAWATLCVVVIWRLVYCAKGKAFYAVSQDEIAAAATGVNTTFFKTFAFVVGAFFAGVAGALSATWGSGNLAPASFNFMRSIEIVVMVVLGGSGSITGSILAAVLLTWLPEELRSLQDWRMVIYALILILMMILRPEGLLGSHEIWWRRRPFGPPGVKDSAPSPVT